MYKNISYSFNVTLDPSSIEQSSNGGTLTVTGIKGTSSSQGLSITSSGNYNGSEGGTGSTSSTGSIAYTGTEVGRVSLSESGTASQQIVNINDITGTITSSVTNSMSTFQFDYNIPFYITDSAFNVSNFDSSKVYAAVSMNLSSTSIDKGYLNNQDVLFEGKSVRYNQYFRKGGHIHSNCVAPLLNCVGSLSFSTSGTGAQTFHITYNIFYVVTDANTNEVGETVNNPVEQGQLNDLNNSTNNIEDSTTNPNGNGILGTIKSFFGSFFENIRNSLIAVFVPEDGYFSNWFNRLNTLLADKLGVLYYPFDLIISFLTDLQNQSSQSGQIVFPEIALPMNGESHVIIERTVLNLGDYDVSFNSSDNSSLVGTTGYTSVVSTIRTFSSFAICLALVFLFIKKLNHIINGEAS